MFPVRWVDMKLKSYKTFKNTAFFQSPHPPKKKEKKIEAKQKEEGYV